MAPSTKPPRLENFEILGETAKHWQGNYMQPNDVIIKMQSHEAVLAVAKLFFEDTYSYFDKFLRDAGMGDLERTYFQLFVFEQLSLLDFLRDESTLVEAITIALKYFYTTPKPLLELMKGLEIEYNVTVECGGLDLPKSNIITLNSLHDLVTKILKTRRKI